MHPSFIRINGKKGERMVELVNHLFKTPLLSHYLPMKVIQFLSLFKMLGSRPAILKVESFMEGGFWLPFDFNYTSGLATTQCIVV